MNNFYEYETPFADVQVRNEESQQTVGERSMHYSFEEFLSPFQTTFESAGSNNKTLPYAEEYVNLLAELKDDEFHEALNDLSMEMEDSWRNKISDEMAMDAQYVPFAEKQAREYYNPLINETDRMVDYIANHYSSHPIGDHNELECESYFNTYEVQQGNYTPIQEQFLGKVFKKVKSVVKKGVDLAKKGIKFVGKFLPINIILDKLKGLIKPLLEKVLRSLLGRLPESLQPYAKNLAKRFLKIDLNENESAYEINDLELLEMEFDNNLAQLLFTNDEMEADAIVHEYTNSIENHERVDGYDFDPMLKHKLAIAKETLINELRNVSSEEQLAPAIENFLPVAMIALKPVIKMGISLIGRGKIINFLAGSLSKLISKYVPAEVSKPLASSIIDMGMSAIGFETYEINTDKIAHETIANTIEETILNLNEITEDQFSTLDEWSSNIYEAFEKAATRNFPPRYLKENLRLSKQPGMLINMPRKNGVKIYKKFTKIYDINLDRKTANAVKIYRNVPLSNFLKDKYGLEINNPISARVHIYELNVPGKLHLISRFEKLPGLNPNIPRSWVQLLPLTPEASNLLLNEPNLGVKFSQMSLSSRYKAKAKHRFYFLELEGVRLKTLPQKNGVNPQNIGSPSEARTADVQGVIDFSKSSVALKYYFSEEDARGIVEKINQNDVIGVATTIKNSINDVFQDIVKNNISSKVKIIHEAMPELYLEHESEIEENFNAKKLLGNVLGGTLIKNVIQKLTELMSSKAFQAVLSFFKSRGREFVDAQAQPADGVTISVEWKDVQGLGIIKSIISAVKGNGSLPSLKEIKLPTFGTPELVIKAGKQFN